MQVLLRSLIICGPLLGAACQHAAPPPARVDKPAVSFRSALLEEHYQRLGEQPQLLSGDRLVVGTVTAVASEQIKVDIGELQPRFVPVKPSEEKRFTVQPGDELILTLNEQNLVVDYHLAGERSGGHSVLRGSIAQHLPVGHDRVVIKTTEGREDSFEIRPASRSKLASIPVGVQGVFLLDETNKIVDATFANPQAVDQARRLPEQKSPLKGSYPRIDGTIIEPLSQDRITIKTQDRGQQSYHVRPLVQEKLATMKKGDAVTVMIDEDDEVIDVAVPPKEKSR
ncbi:exported protein of unknown function [Nitrospira sp. KM1]|uniref:hypothetical protein n=1 Tax=Nitrospira sp. KM1 TaxID=1936990 RepID=UPI0013A72D7A|nr:hypothetical protein [Nitrospira sp. KM1]BCA55708.1 exported protein of unknown function [Nitrospira sp. KM1]